MGRFSAGDAVRIASRDCTEHHRVPDYAKGKVGIVERVSKRFGQPEKLASGLDGKPFQTLYRIRLNQVDLWKGYEGSRRDTLEIEIFEHWLEAVDDQELA